jgi:hypothetical protein
MEKFNIVVISPNKFKFDKNCVADQEILLTEINELLEIKQVTLDTMMETIVNVINLTPQLMGDTTVCYENQEYVYQLCHMRLKENNMEEDFKYINGISSYLVSGKEEIYGYTVLIKSKISDNFNCIPSSIINKTEIAELLMKRIRHTGVIVYSDGLVEDMH